MIALPLLAGAVKLSVTWPLPGVPTTLVGAPGSVYGVRAPEAVDGALVPSALVAVTVKV